MRGTTLFCVVAMCALAALSFFPTSKADGPECVSKEACPQGEHCVQYAGGDWSNFRSCLPAGGKGETCSSWPGDIGIYVQSPPCQEGLKCGVDVDADDDTGPICLSK